jgi:hypothetical protein
MLTSKHRLTPAAVILCGCFLFLGMAGIASAQPAQGDFNKRLSIRLSGGAGLALDGGGDLESNRQGWVNYFSDINQLLNYTSSASWKKLSLIPEGQVELLFPVTSFLSIAVGGGYIQARSKGTHGFSYDESDVLTDGSYRITQSTNYARDYTLSAIPVTASLFLVKQVGRLNIYGYAGAGYYFGTLKHAYTARTEANWAIYAAVDEQYEITDNITGTESVKKNGIGYHGGIGLELKLGSSLALGLEAYGRYVAISGWTGSYNETQTTNYRAYQSDLGWYDDETVTDKYSDTGTLKYYEFFDSDLGRYYPEIAVYNQGDSGTQQPSGEGIRATRDAKINLNAVGVRLSLRIFFNFR